MLKRVVSCLVFLSIVTLLPTVARGQVREAVLSEINFQGTIDAIDHTGRTVTIRGQQGNFVTLDVPTSVTRFDQLKVGDRITAAYYDRVNVRLKPAGEPAVDRRVAPNVTTPSPGLLPSGTIANQRVATATITAWDPTTKTISFTGPNGTAYSRKLTDALDPSIVAGLKPGDRVDVTWTEALRVNVESQGAGATRAVAGAAGAAAGAVAGAAGAVGQAAAAPVQTFERLKDRVTLSILWGPDNSFSGKMIKSASGQTVSGVPINLSETTFDDVYGRIGLFKLGVGYRTSPRMEGIFNF